MKVNLGEEFKHDIGVKLISMFIQNNSVAKLFKFINDEKLLFKFEKISNVDKFMHVYWKREGERFKKIEFAVQPRDIDKLKMAIRKNKINCLVD